MERIIGALTVAEKMVIILVAIAALFPMYQWVSETETRTLQRTIEIINAVELCETYDTRVPTEKLNLATHDFYEEVCIEINLQLKSWYRENFDE